MAIDSLTRAASDARAAQRFEGGARVRILPAYQGDGGFADTGIEGTATVVEVVLDPGERDPAYLVRPDRFHDPRRMWWIRASRMVQT